MKRIMFSLALLASLFLVGVGCNNANTDTNASTKDTSATKDTIKSNPEEFSQPH